MKCCFSPPPIFSECLSEPQHVFHSSSLAWINSFLNLLEIRWFILSCHVCAVFVTSPSLSLSDFVLFLGECSIPTHVPHTVTVHTAVARVPSPTLVCSTVPPYRYMAQLWMLQSTHSVLLTWLCFYGMLLIYHCKVFFSEWLLSHVGMTLQDVNEWEFSVV